MSWIAAADAAPDTPAAQERLVGGQFGRPSGRTFTTSAMANRPPGFSTRNASRNTCALSGTRLITQFEMITSPVASAIGRCSSSPRRNSTLAGPDAGSVGRVPWPASRASCPRRSRGLSGPTCFAARKQSKPAPLPRSISTSPGRSAAIAWGIAAAKAEIGAVRHRTELRLRVADAGRLLRLRAAAGGGGGAACGTRRGDRAVAAADQVFDVGIVHGWLLWSGGPAGSRRIGRCAAILRGTPAAAVLGQVGDQSVHRRVVGGVDQLPPNPALGDETRPVQVLHVEGQRRRWHAQPFGDDARGQSGRTLLTSIRNSASLVPWASAASASIVPGLSMGTLRHFDD